MKKNEIERRSIVKGAAWSVPVLAAAVTVPMAAASGLDEETYTIWVEPTPDPSGSGTDVAAATCGFTLPAGAKNISYEVYGGGGGGAGGGQGAVMKGIIATPTVDTPISVIAGAGGIWGGTTRTPGAGQGPFPGPRVALGGKGFGNGGDSPMPEILTGDMTDGGGGGGGGSAIIVEDNVGWTALVVAGGGGGAGSLNGRHEDTLWGQPVERGYGGYDVTNPNGHAPDATAQDTDKQTGDVRRDYRVPGGRVGTGTAGGAGSTGASYQLTSGATNWTQGPGTMDGLQGSGPSATSGGNGANGIQVKVTEKMWQGATIAETANSVSGAGGGGYSGGGSGGGLYAATEYEAGLTLTSGGGAGASYAGDAGGLVVTNTTASSSDATTLITGQGAPGLVYIVFTAQPGLDFPGCS